MRRRVAIAHALTLGLALVAGPAASVAAQPADPVTRLLADLQEAIAAGQPNAISALTSADLSPEGLAVLVGASSPRPAEVALRERVRRHTPAGTELLVELFVASERAGRTATWTLETRPGTAANAEIVRVEEVGTLGGLVRQVLDPTPQYQVRDLVLSAVDFTVTMASGTAFAWETAQGTTGLVFRGNGRVRLAPPSETEQGQLRLLNGRPVFETAFNEAFIRINPLEFDRHVRQGSLVPADVAAGELRRAEAVFADRAPRTFSVALGDLSGDSWSLVPPMGTFVVEFRAGRFGWLTYLRMPLDREDVALLDREGRRYLTLYESEDARAQRQGRQDLEEAPFDVLHYDLDVQIDPRSASIAGRGSLVLRRRSTGPEALTLKLSEPLAVRAVSSPGIGRLMAMRIADSDQLIVLVPESRIGSPDLRLDIEYGGPLQPQVIDREALLPPQISDADGLLLIGPTPRFLYSTRHPWYPQGPASDHATATLRIAAPAGYSVVATGVHLGTEPAGEPDASGAQVFRFGTVRPVRYLACVLSQWEPVSRTEVEVPAVTPVEGAAPPTPAPASVALEVVATPRQLGANRETAARAADILSFYASRLGEAPYPALTIAAADDRQPGGHAPAYFALLQQPLPMSRVSWMRDPVAFDDYPDFVLAHELAHQWWGQAVGWRTYHDQWLSEGLAQHFAALYLEASRGTEAAGNLLAEMRRSVAGLAAQGPIALGYRLGQIEGDSRIFRAVLYNKSAVVLDMLRRLIGEEAFLAGTREFYREWRFRKAGTRDFQATLQRHTSRPLGRFFERWIDGAALPELHVTWRLDAERTTALVHVRQRAGVFDLPLTMTVEYANGRSEDIDLIVTDETSDHRIPLTGPVRRIRARADRTLAAITP